MCICDSPFIVENVALVVSRTDNPVAAGSIPENDTVMGNAVIPR